MLQAGRRGEEEPPERRPRTGVATRAIPRLSSCWRSFVRRIMRGVRVTQFACRPPDPASDQPTSLIRARRELLHELAARAQPQHRRVHEGHGSVPSCVLAQDHPVRSRWSWPTRPAPGFGPSPVYRASGIDPINLRSTCSVKDSIARPESQVNRQVAKFGGRTGIPLGRGVNLGRTAITSVWCDGVSTRPAPRDPGFQGASARPGPAPRPGRASRSAHPRCDRPRARSES